MTWPFGGLPLGGVFLGQARGPLVELARLGGPLLITAGVWAGGVAVAHSARPVGAPTAGGGGPSLVGAVGRLPSASSRWPWSARWRPTAARPMRHAARRRSSKGAASGA